MTRPALMGPMAFIRSAAAALILASTGLLPTARLTPTASADVPPLTTDDNVLRLMVKVNRIHIFDPGDPSYETGEPSYTVTMQRIADGCGGICHGDARQWTFSYTGVNSGDVKDVNAYIPPYRPKNDQYFIQPEPGLDVYPDDGHYILVKVNGSESDPVFDDNLGSFEERLPANQNFGMGVEHQTKSTNANDIVGCGIFGCDNPAGFQVDYEIVKAPLPDLVVSDIRVGNFADNGDDIVCATVNNQGPEPAAAFQHSNGYLVRFYVDGQIPRNGESVRAGPLAPGASDDASACFQTNIAAGTHNFLATVDEDHLIPEMDESNNRRGTTAAIARRGPGGQILPISPIGEGVLEPVTEPAANPTPTPTPSPARADLVPVEILVKGKTPSGENDCDPGKNDVTVQVKNQGGADAGRFAVALLVDDDLDDGGKESVPSLARGQQRQVRFDDVKLGKGRHTLMIQVDADGQIAESDETNNGLPVQVSCKNED